MAKESNMLSLGTKAPFFRLTDVTAGKEISLNDFSDQICVIMFICNHCPYVKHINDQLVHLGKDYMNKGVAFIAINSNDVESYPEDSPEKMKETAHSLHYPFPYLFDETQEVAKSYNAACTPDFYIFDQNHLLAYRGQLDDSRPKNSIKVTGQSIREALDKLLAGESVSPEQKPSIGCGIKWKEA